MVKTEYTCELCKEVIVKTENGIGLHWDNSEKKLLTAGMDESFSKYHLCLRCYWAIADNWTHMKRRLC